MNTTTATPREIDTALAAKWGEISKAEKEMGWTVNALLMLAGAKYYYRGRQRVTDMTVDQAVAICTEQAAIVAAYKADPANTVNYGGYTGTEWHAWSPKAAHGLQPYDSDKPAKYLAELTERRATLAALHAEERAMQALYTGWSRFFVVTSSAGHVHSSMQCSTCRITTTYGWLPELSGKTEADAVAELGPALCSVCFPSAPVEYVGGKLTAAKAAKVSA